MGDVVNLRQARKAKARADKTVAADANRAQFGQTKGEKTSSAHEANRRKTLLDNARLED